MKYFYQAYERQVEKGKFDPNARKVKPPFQELLLAGPGVVLMRIAPNLKKRLAASQKLGGSHILGKLGQ